MSADRLRDAARVLRERAEAATPGPWEGHGGDVERYFSHIGEWGLVAKAEYRSVPYIATMHPGVGLALAKALDTAAEAMEHSDLCMDCFHPTCLTVGELIPVADLILGAES